MSIDQAASPSSIACDTGISLLHLANKLLDAQTKVSDSPTHNTVKEILNKSDGSPSDVHNDGADIGNDLPKVKRKLWETSSQCKKRKVQSTCVTLDDNQNTVHVYCASTADTDSVNNNKEFIVENTKENAFSDGAKTSFMTPEKDYNNTFLDSPFHGKTVVNNNTLSPSGRKIAKKYQCDQCKYETDNRSHLRRHQNCKHINFKPYYCYVCYEEFARSEKVRSHFIKDHPEIDYDGFKVRKTYGPESASAHARSVKVKEITPEKATNETVSTQSANTGSPVFNGVKNNINLTPTSLKKHHCPDCAYSGKDSWHLKRHISEVHKGDKEFKCPKCEYATSRKHRIISHMKGHGQLDCFYCDYQTESAEEFQDHLRECSRSNKPKSYICEHCNQSLSSMSEFFIHVERNHNIPLYRCSSCAFATTDQKNLNKHELIHLTPMQNITPVRLHECSECSLVFPTLASLNEHVEFLHSVKNNNNVSPQVAINSGNEVPKDYSTSSSIGESKNASEMSSNAEPDSEKATEEIGLDVILSVEIMCSICGDDFQSNEDLNNHMMSEHDNE